MTDEHGSGDGFGFAFGFGSGFGMGYGYEGGYGHGDSDEHGYGSGFGDESGFGHGYGHGSGNGHRSGYGDGYWDGSGSGIGGGDGDWAGYGSGHPHGYGFGNAGGDVLCRVQNRTVILLSPWPYLRVGCTTLHIDEWLLQWRKLAQESRVDVDEKRALEILADARAALGEDGVTKSDGACYIVCVGNHGRAVVVGWSEDEPKVGVAVRLNNARMILYWSRDCGGLFGLAAGGPRGDTRITAAVPYTECVPEQILRCSDDASAAMMSWPDA